MRVRFMSVGVGGYSKSVLNLAAVPTSRVFTMVLFGRVGGIGSASDLFLLLSSRN